MRVLEKCVEIVRVRDAGNSLRMLPLMIFITSVLKLKFVIALFSPINSS
jgi:hypothetical protein